MISGFGQLEVFLRNYLQFYTRTKRLAGLAIFTAAVSVLELTLYLSGLSPKPPSPDDFAQHYIGINSSLVYVIAAFLGGDALAFDLSSRTALVIMAQPIRRVHMLAGRFLAGLAMGVAVTGIYYLGSLAGLVSLYGSVPFGLLPSFLLSILLLASALSVAFLFGSVFKNGGTAIVGTLLLLIVGFFGIEGALEQANLEPWFLLNYGGQVVSAVIPASYPPHQLVSPVNTAGFVMAFEPYLWEGIVIMLAYACATIVPCLFIFQRREIR